MSNWDNQGMPRAKYDTAVICLNGHEVNSSMNDYPEYNEKFCHECGAQTISTCQRCSEPIRGFLRGSLVAAYHVPAYCHSCGTPYPWTAARQAAARELIEMADVPEAEKLAAIADLPSLAQDTPRTGVAAAKMGKLLARLSGPAGAALKDLLINVATESALKLMHLK